MKLQTRHFLIVQLFFAAFAVATATGNEPPVLDPIGPKSASEGTLLTFNVSASDPDGTIPGLWVESTTLPTGARFFNHLDGTGTFEWTPSYDQAGRYYVTFKAADTQFTDSEVVTIDVEDYDPGIRDSIELVVVLQPDEANSQLNVQLELYVFSDSTVIGATAAFSWDNPNLQMDSAVATPLVDTGFDYGPFLYEDDDVNVTNANQRFLIGGSKVFSIGIPGNPSGRQLWATYYFTLSSWNATDSIVIDSTLIPPTNRLLFTVPDTVAGLTQTSYTPVWIGKVVIKDATDVEIIDGSGLPLTYSLSQNYPNPFNPATEINFGIPVRSHVTLIVYNILGQKVTTLVDEELAPNRYVINWDGTSDNGRNIASGVYFYKLEADDFIETRKMMLIK